jgi:hypothetical protein
VGLSGSLSAAANSKIAALRLNAGGEFLSRDDENEECESNKYGRDTF